MPEKKKKTQDEAYDDRARALMRAIDVRRSERAADAPAVHMMQRVRDEYGREAQIRDTTARPFEFFPSDPSPGYEYQRQRDKSIEATAPWRTGEAPRSLWNKMLFDRGRNEGISDISGTPGELLPPYRAKAARQLAFDEEFYKKRNPKTADKRVMYELEQRARGARERTPPVTQEDFDAMRESLTRPGETSTVRDPINVLPPEAQFEERLLRNSVDWARKHSPKKKGK